MTEREMTYAEKLSRMIRHETVSKSGQTDLTKFREFHGLLRELFPDLFAVCDFEEFDGSILLRWKGSGGGEPALFMNHHDVVEAQGEWTHEPFSGDIADGKVWGRGAVDTKGGLMAMLQAADELAHEGFTPKRDIYFESACTEECDGSGADTISKTLKERGVHFYMCLDEGGAIMYDPIGGADGTFAMVGLGEKGCADLKFTAESNGGHASTPGKDTPLVRLGKFMAAAEKADIFKAEISPVTHEMFRRLSGKMHGPLKFVLGHSKAFAPVIKAAMPRVSDTANAILKTTAAFTMAGGSDGRNVLPAQAWVVGNMRYSHHQGKKASIDAITELASKYGVKTEIIDGGFESPVSPFDTRQFRLVEEAVSNAFPGVGTSPYIMNGASDSRFMSRVCDNVLRFAPLLISEKQLESIHGIDESVDVETLPKAVDFYKYVIREV